MDAFGKKFELIVSFTIIAYLLHIFACSIHWEESEKELKIFQELFIYERKINCH